MATHLVTQLLPLTRKTPCQRSDAVRPSSRSATRALCQSLRLTVVPLDEKDVSCCTSPVGRRSKRESAHEPAARSHGPMEVPDGHSSTRRAS